MGKNIKKNEFQCEYDVYMLMVDDLIKKNERAAERLKEQREIRKQSYEEWYDLNKPIKKSKWRK